jgi:DNA polymerase phi
MSCANVVNIQEERDFYFGQLFGLTVLIQSEILLRTTTSPEAIVKTVDHLIRLALTKPWLREPALQALCGLISALPQLKNGHFVAATIQNKLEVNKILQSQDGAGIALAMFDLPKDFKISSNKVWQQGDPLHTSNLQLLSKVLKDVPSEDDTIKQSGNFKGEAHFIWKFILQRYLNPSKEMIKFTTLWNNVVESISFYLLLMIDGFFISTSSLERKFRGFQLFSMFLPQLPKDLIPVLFTQNFLRCLINHSSAGDRYLNKAAKKSVCLRYIILILAIHNPIGVCWST